MTRAQFIARAVSDRERAIGVPVGWWGTWIDVRGPKGQRVHRTNGGRFWIVSVKGRTISGHDSRKGAIAKARRL